MLRKPRFRRKKDLIFIVIFVAAFLSTTAYAALYKDLNISGIARITNSTSNLEFRHSVSTTTQGPWTNYNFEIEVENISFRAVDSWLFTISVPDDIRNLECFDIVCTLNGNTMALSNDSSNSLIMPGEVVVASMTFRTRDGDYEIDPEPDPDPDPDPEPDPDPDPDPDDPIDEDFEENILVTTILVNNYTQGRDQFYEYELTIENNNEQTPTSSWSFQVPLEGRSEFSSASNVNYVVSSNMVEFSNTSSNGTINPGSSTTLNLNFVTHRNDTFSLVVENFEVSE